MDEIRRKELLEELEASRRRVEEIERELMNLSTAPTRTVLVVDDEKVVRETVKDMLQQHHYTCIEAGNAEDAISAVTGHDGPIHLVLTDIVMPGMNAQDMVNRLSEIQPGILTLYMTGFSEGTVVPQDVYDIMDSEANLISKPFTMDGLIDKVREVMS